MKRVILFLGLLLLQQIAMAELAGDSQAIADARAMVETMGGAEIWCELESVHFVHEWDIANRHDRYLENEILDLTGSNTKPELSLFAPPEEFRAPPTQP